MRYAASRLVLPGDLMSNFFLILLVGNNAVMVVKCDDVLLLLLLTVQLVLDVQVVRLNGVLGWLRKVD